MKTKTIASSGVCVWTCVSLIPFFYEPTEELGRIRHLDHDTESTAVVMGIAELLGLGTVLECVYLHVYTLCTRVRVKTLQVAQRT